MSAFFDIRDLVLFHKIVFERVPVYLPNFIRPYTGHGPLPHQNLDSLSFVSHIISKIPNTSIDGKSPFYKSFLHKVLYIWNRLPFSIRNIPDEPNFKRKVTDYFCEQLNSGSISIPIS